MLTSWFLVTLLQTANAGSPDVAAALLSRYPAGRVPGTVAVFDAITDIQTQGQAEHLSVLHSLRRHEDGDVKQAAELALAVVTLRARLERREAFTAPDSRDVRRWLSGRETPLTYRDGNTVNRKDQEVIAYAALITGGPRKFEDTSISALLLEAERLEDDADANGALAAYALAAAQGDRLAFDAIEGFGVDAESLLLGISADVLPALKPAAPPQTLEQLSQRGSTKTVAVLVERSQQSGDLGRAVALDALAGMLRREELPANARRWARQELESAARDSEDSLNAFARSTLNEVD